MIKTDIKGIKIFLIIFLMIGFFTLSKIAQASTPVISNGLPTGILPSITTQITISVQTDVDATCKYAFTPSTAYDDANFSHLFETTDGTTHSKTLDYLQETTSGQIFNFYVRCSDADGNINQTPFLINFSVAALTEPTLSNGSPSGILETETTETLLEFFTLEFVTCRISTLPGVAFDSMTQQMQDHGTHHSVPIIGLSPGYSYTYYVRCSYPIGNPNTTDFPISFSVASPDLSPPDAPTGMTVS